MPLYVCCSLVSYLSLFVNEAILMTKVKHYFFSHRDLVHLCALCSTHSPPPEGVCIGVEVYIDVFLCQVDEEGGKDQDQETYVPGCNQHLRGRQRRGINHTSQQQQQHLYHHNPCCHYRITIIVTGEIPIIITFGFHFFLAARFCLDS